MGTGKSQPKGRRPRRKQGLPSFPLNGGGGLCFSSSHETPVTYHVVMYCMVLLVTSQLMFTKKCTLKKVNLLSVENVTKQGLNSNLSNIKWLFHQNGFARFTHQQQYVYLLRETTFFLKSARFLWFDGMGQFTLHSTCLKHLNLCL